MEEINWKQHWTEKVQKALKGRKIVDVRYMNDKEVENLGWHSAAIVLILDNGHLLFPSRDDEGNDAGAIFTTIDELNTIPVI